MTRAPATGRGEVEAAGIDRNKRMTTSDVANELGYTQAWVRTQIALKRLLAQEHVSSRRRSYRIRRVDFGRFVARWIRRR
jgi:predicted ArsR family transcriptional regulator